MHTQGQVIISLLLGDKLNSGKDEFGLEGGLSLSSQSGLDKSKALSSLSLGFYFDIKLKEPWAIHTGIIVKSNMGAAGLPVYSTGQPGVDSLFVGASVERKLSYFNGPAMLKYYFANHFYIEAGTQLGLLYKAFDEFSKTENDDELTDRRDIRKNFHPLDAGITAGLGYRLIKGNGMNIEIRYYYGLVDVVVDDSGKGVFNRSLYFTAAIPIGAGKAKKKALNNDGK
jgi:hypothetical protein